MIIAKRSLKALISTVLCVPFMGAAHGDIRVDANTNPVQVYVEVTLSDGQPVTGLDASAFSLVEGEAAQAVTAAVSPQSNPVSVVFLMDFSYSMRQSESVAAMQEAVKDALAKLGTDDRAAIIKFSGSDTVQEVHAFTNDFAALTAVVDQDPGVEWGSMVYDNLGDALDLFVATDLPATSRAVVLLSDGLDKRSTTEYADLLARLDDAGVAVFPIGYGAEVQMGILEEIAEVSGGQLDSALDADSLVDVYSGVVDGLKNEYVLSYDSALSDTDCTPQTVTVNVQTVEGPKTYSTSFARCTAFDVTSESNQPVAGKAGGGGANDLGAALALALLTLVRRRRNAK